MYRALGAVAWGLQDCRHGCFEVKFRGLHVGEVIEVEQDSYPSKPGDLQSKMTTQHSLQQILETSSLCSWICRLCASFQEFIAGTQYSQMSTLF